MAASVSIDVDALVSFLTLVTLAYFSFGKFYEKCHKLTREHHLVRALLLNEYIRTYLQTASEARRNKMLHQ